MEWLVEAIVAGVRAYCWHCHSPAEVGAARLKARRWFGYRTGFEVRVTPEFYVAGQ